jgi:hypothetical protein
MDTYEGNNEDPLSLHKYLYCEANPVNMVDPSGHDVATWLLGRMVSYLNFNASGFVAEGSFLEMLAATGALPSLGVEVYSHGTPDPSYSHAYLKITPDDPKEFPGENMQTDHNGKKFFTISGDEHHLRLIKLINSRNDVDAILNGNAKDRGPVSRSYSTSSQLINDILFAYSSYKENLTYNAFPSAHQNVYNSNSFEHGILNAVHAHGPDLSEIDNRGIEERLDRIHQSHWIAILIAFLALIVSILALAVAWLAWQRPVADSNKQSTNTVHVGAVSPSP